MPWKRILDPSLLKARIRKFPSVFDGSGSDRVVICELVLVELFALLCSPRGLKKPLSSPEAVEVCQVYRTNPGWRLVENAPVMKHVWRRVSQKGFARRRIFDARLSLTLQRHQVTELATANVKDFEGFGFQRVWNPLEP
jgi:uncharacterized protein